MSYAAHLLLLALRSQCGVGVRGDHGRNWMEVTEMADEGSG